MRRETETVALVGWYKACWLKRHVYVPLSYICMKVKQNKMSILRSDQDSCNMKHFTADETLFHFLGQEANWVVRKLRHQNGCGDPNDSECMKCVIGKMMFLLWCWFDLMLILKASNDDVMYERPPPQQTQQKADLASLQNLIWDTLLKGMHE